MLQPPDLLHLLNLLLFVSVWGAQTGFLPFSVIYQLTVNMFPLPNLALLEEAKPYQPQHHTLETLLVTTGLHKARPFY